jgi:hypothetical protein
MGVQALLLVAGGWAGSKLSLAISHRLAENVHQQPAQ